MKRILRFARYKLRAWKHMFFTEEHSQLIQISCPDVLIIAPGTLSVPPKGWGAVETVVFDHKKILEEAGLRVSLLNSRNIFDWIKAFSKFPKITLSHYDMHAKKALIFSRACRSRLVSISHYGYAGFTEKWSPDYRKLARSFTQSKLVICLSDLILETLSENFPDSEYIVFNNRLTAAPTKGNHAKMALYLGKIEPRKRQAEIIELVRNYNFDLHFVGPIADPRVDPNLLFSSVDYLGEWSREEVVQRLGEYKVLVLASDGEADALVIHEALLAGLVVVATKSASGSFKLFQSGRLRIVDSIDEIPGAIADALSNFSPPSNSDLADIKAKSLWHDKAKREFSELLLSVL